jgi:exodeoxyribonuclease-5
MDWTREQETALTHVAQWLRRGDTPVFRLFGFAGTGKTTLARHVAEGVDGEVAFAAFTGKAALVMRSRGCEGASTIHSLIYRTRGEGEDGPTFALHRSGPASKAGLIVIDECSMVDEELGRDLLSFGKPILVLGDPAQLPPVKGGGFFTEAEPDVMLTEIHRQAKDDPIVHLSMLVREGGRLPRGTFGESRVIGKADLATPDVIGADQVLVGLNRTRRLYNQRLRDLSGFSGPTPQAGERLVCLRNDRTKGLLNGGLWTVVEAKGEAKGFVRLDVATAEEGMARQRTRVSVLKEFFEGREEEVPFKKRRESDEFDFGYALTVHKAQGSQWDEVVLFDESYAFREHRARWLYTGLTRAARKIIVVTG